MSDIPSYVAASKVKETVKGAELRTSSDVADAVNAKVHQMLTDAVARAKANNRGTVKPQDL